MKRGRLQDGIWSRSQHIQGGFSSRFWGLRGIELQAGVAIAPAIGSFNGSVVFCALAMGASSVGMGAMREGCRG